MSDEANSWRKEKYKAMLEAGGHAINRARYVFIAINVAGIFILIGLFNATFPWLRNSIVRAKVQIPPPDHLPHIEKTVYEDLWTMTAPLLGVKISVFDIAVIGSAALFVLAVWQYYCVRRENTIVYKISKEASDAIKNGDIDAASYLYHGIVHHFVFTTKLSDFTPAGQTPRPAPTGVVRALIFMPAWIPLLIILSELFTIFIPTTLALDPTTMLWYKFNIFEKIEEIFRILIAGGLGAWSMALCSQTLRYDMATRTALEPLVQALD